jgi:two-component system response regulator AtoC
VPEVNPDTPQRRVLVVDDEENVRHMLRLLLESEGWSVDTADSGHAALESLERRPADVVLCDLKMPGMSGREVVQRLREGGQTPTVILMSAYGDRELAIEVIREGAYDFVAKPFEPEDLALTLLKAEERERLRHENRHLKQVLGEPLEHPGIVGSSRAMQELLATAKKVAPHQTTVLLLGESGTGKELVARFIHDHSDTAEGPFVPVNCGAIPGALLESELFGHTRGAFTGATRARPGLVAEADGGTLFLDEVGELPLDLQVKLLRTLQEGTVRAVGDDRERGVQVRVLAATSRDLPTMVDAGEFRQDLYYRINVISLPLPPLRDRAEDIVPLARHFLARHGARLGLEGYTLSPTALRTMLDYPWPGNVRELENAIERALVLSLGPEIEVDDLPPQMVGDNASEALAPGEELLLKPAVKSLEERYLRTALSECRGNRTAAAKRLGIALRTLHYKLREYGLDEVGKEA